MENIWKYIKDYSKHLWENYKVYIILIACLLVSLSFCVYFYTEMSNARIEAKTNKHNIEALQDTIKTYVSKSGDIVATKMVLQGELNDMKKLQNELYNEIKDMKIKGEVTSGVVVKTIYKEVEKLDTTWVVQNTDTTIVKNFNFNNEYRTLEGQVKLNEDTLGISIDKHEVNMDYSVAFTKDRIYIKSNNPYVSVTNIDGFTLPKQKTKRWGVGPQVGYGYDIINKKASPYIGVGLHYSILLW